MNLKERNFESEFRFKTSRSSGAGGQHVNTTETKVEVIFDVMTSNILTDSEKALLLKRLSNQLNDKGELRISSSESRSQATNKEKAVAKFYVVVSKALKREKKRIPTKKPVEIKEEILKTKKLHSRKKEERRFNPREFM
jgi:ribosome-associated protein